MNVENQKQPERSDSELTTYHYNDSLEPGGRHPRLYLAKGGQVVKFKGESIADFCVVEKNIFTKAGKWSNTDYQLGLVRGVRPLYFLSPLHQVWGDQFTTWSEVAAELALPLEAAQTIVKSEYPKTAKRLDKIENFTLEQEAKGELSETVIISFGSPTLKQAAAGFWQKEKVGHTTNGVEVIVKPKEVDAANYPRDGRSGWYEAEVVSPVGAKIASIKEYPGMHGGSFALEVVVPVGQMNQEPTVVPDSATTEEQELTLARAQLATAAESTPPPLSVAAEPTATENEAEVLSNEALAIWRDKLNKKYQQN